MNVKSPMPTLNLPGAAMNTIPTIVGAQISGIAIIRLTWTAHIPFPKRP